MIARGKIQIFSCRGARKYANRVIKELKSLNKDTKKYTDLKGKLQVRKFADGEMELDIGESIRKKDVYLFQNCSQRNEHGLSVNENKVELYHAIDALKRAQANSLTVFEPYSSPSRSDRATRRCSVGFWTHAKTMISLGMDHYITFQLHSEKSKTIFDPKYVNIDDMPATSLLKKYILKNFVKTKEYFNNEVKNNWAFCSVDAGGKKMARKFAEVFNTHLVVANKRRSIKRANMVENIDILSDMSLKGKTIWIVDDMIDTGGSIKALVEELKEREVKEVNIAIIHPVFSDPAIERMKKLTDDGILKNIICLDTIYVSDEVKNKLPNLKVVSSAKFAADLIYRINIGMSITKFFSGIETEEYLT